MDAFVVIVGGVGHRPVFDQIFVERAEGEVAVVPVAAAAVFNPSLNNSPGRINIPVFLGLMQDWSDVGDG